MKCLCTQHGSVSKQSSNHCYNLVIVSTFSEDITQYLQQRQQQQQQQQQQRQQQQQLSVSVYI